MRIASTNIVVSYFEYGYRITRPEREALTTFPCLADDTILSVLKSVVT